MVVQACGCLAVLVLAASCPAQSINIDLGPENGAPPASYSAAGLAGTWNALGGTLERATSLVGLDGAATTASIRVENAFGTLGDVPLPHPEIGAHQALLGDGLLGAHGPKVPIVVHIEGLEPGAYRLLTYTWYWPVSGFAQAAFVAGSPLVMNVGGPWPGGPLAGVTHMVHVVDASGGSVSFELVGSGPGSFFNGDILLQGIQLWKIDEPAPCAADLDGDGAVAVTDLVALVTSWGPCPVPPRECPGDLDGDGAVAAPDLVILVLSWGGCAPVPATCDGTDAGDCYAAHDLPGCAEPSCCDAICALDPYCCDTAWDAACAGLANLTPGSCAGAQHPNCGNPEAGDCFESIGKPGCADSACCAVVCAADNFCCAFEWDLICVDEATELCAR